MSEAGITDLSKSWLLLIKDHLKLMRLESELAQASIFPLLASGLAMTLFACTLWALLLLLMGYSLYLHGYEAIYCLLAVIAANVAAIFIAYLKLISCSKRMTFKHTRSRLKEIFK